MFRSRLPILLAEKEHRERRKITQRELAKDTNLARATIASWMSTDNMPRLDSGTVAALCKYFGCDLEDLVELEGEAVAVPVTYPPETARPVLAVTRAADPILAPAVAARYGG